jgi:hypothetical protein
MPQTGSIGVEASNYATPVFFDLWRHERHRLVLHTDYFPRAGGTFSDFEPVPNNIGMQTRVGKLYKLAADRCQVFRAYQPKSVS